MQLRSVSAVAVGLVAASTAVMLALVLTLPAAAQPAGINPKFPPEAQARLDKLQADLKTTQRNRNAQSQARTLNAIGDLYFVVSALPQAEDNYSQALTLARSGKDAHAQAAALNGTASCYRVLSQNDKALTTYQQALDIATAAADLLGQATALNGIGWVNANTSQYQKALEFHNRALSLAQTIKDEDLEAQVRSRIADVAYSMGERQKALDAYKQTVAVFAKVGDLDNEADTLLSIGVLYRVQGDPHKALEYYEQALPLTREVGDRLEEATALKNIGRVRADLGEPQKALDFYSQAMQIQREVGDRDGEATLLCNIGVVYSGLGNVQKVLDYFNQALPIYRQLGNGNAEAITLNNIGSLYSDLGEHQKAMEYFNQALPLYRKQGDRDGEASTLNNIGLLWSRLGDKRKALEYYDQVLPVFRALGERKEEAITLNNIGSGYAALGEPQKALDYYNQALSIRRQVGDRNGEAVALNNIGGLEIDLGDPQRALDDYGHALTIFQKVTNRYGEGAMLSNIGTIYNDLGEAQKALGYLEQALPIRREVGDRDGEATTLNNIGLAYGNLGDPKKELDYYNQALPILEKVGDRYSQGSELNNIGYLYSGLREWQKALDHLNRALPIRRELGDRDGEALTLNNIGFAYLGLGDSQKALDNYSQALPIASSGGNPLLEAGILSGLMVAQKDQRPLLAVFYGKQAVNLVQQVRGKMQGLDKELQKSFLASNSDYYRGLAEVLITQGRLPEAEQVLDLLKQQEYSDYTRGEAANGLSAVALTPAEQAAEKEYQDSTAQAVALGQEWAELRKTPARTAEQEARLKVVSGEMAATNAGFSDYAKRLYALLGADNNANRQVADVQGDVSELKQALTKMPRTVALYTLVGKDRYRVIVVTGTTQVAREFAIPEEEMNKEVAALQAVLRDKRSDPRPAARELYTILIGPVEKDLELAKAETLVWSLDGVLRYVPMAALYDGKQYMVEKYNTVTITPVSIPHLGEKPDVSGLSAAAMGISQKYEERLPALEAVVGELDDIVKDPQVAGANGVLPGTILLNNGFTEKAMEDQLAGQHGVVHIASHFVFNPGDDKQSYLLLAGGDANDKDAAGKGFHLTVADFNANPNLTLNDTELLTLSACETGMGGTASNGREVDGLGTTAQKKGAKAVISTLWSVNDASTGELMADFYSRWAGGGGKVEKVEALRQAQLDLLLGKAKGRAKGDANGRGIAVEVGPASEAEASTGFAHPYYWAPFVLMGNWR